MSDREGEQLGNYRLIRYLGEGSFADVYLGEHVYLKRQAAIKVLRARLAKNDMEGFLIEARTIAGLEHPNIVQVLDFGVEDSIPFLVMSYAPNGTLRQRHPDGIPLPPTVVLPYVKQIASALQYAHDRKLIHRDIKPHNLLLSPRNDVWISDFGLVLIAQSTLSQVTQNPAGTPAYMAPEQFSGKPRPASDQYALGVVVYEWLCGERPFHGTYSELFSQHNFIPAPPLREKIPVITPAVEEVVLTALAKDPYKRFANISAFANALEQACKSEPYLLPGSDFELPPPSPRVEPPPSANATPVIDSLYSAAPTALPQRLSPVAEQQSAAPALQVSPGAAQNTHAPGLLKASASPELYTEPGTHAPSLAPDSPTVADTPMPAQPTAPRKREIPRRTVLVGLAGTVVALGGGATLVWRYVSNAQGSRPAGTSTINPPSHSTTPTAVPAGTTIFTYQRHHDGVRAVAWSPNGQFIASGSLDKTVRVWNAPPNGQDLSYSPYTKHSQALKALTWSPNGQFIASGSEDATVRVWDATNGNDLSFSPYRGHSKTIRSVAWSPNGQFIASGSEDNTVRVWNAATGQDLPFSPYTRHTSQVITVAWSPGSKHVASASFDKTVRIWSASDGQDVSFSPLVHSAGVRAVAWSNDGNYIATGGNDRTIHLWNAKTGQLIHTFSPVHGDSVESLAWSHDGKYIASGSFDSTVKVWNVATGDIVVTYHHHTNQIWSVSWLPNGYLIASASIDRTVQIWKAV